jgi:DNA polymerase-1
MTVADTLSNAVVVDFETEGIQARPKYPPRPVGVAIRWPGGDGAITEYLAFAHPNGVNNATFEEAGRALRKAWRYPVVFHNAKFDTEVAHAAWGLQLPHEYHDTMILAYLREPHAPSFGLKPLTERWLGMPPTQQDAVRDWILEHVTGSTAKNFGAYISLAPVDLVAPYAISDANRTYALFAALYPKIMLDMASSYQREMRLLPWLLNAERRGVRVDRALLTSWAEQLDALITTTDARVRERLGVPTLSLDEDASVAEAIDRAGLVSVWERTPTGKRATNRAAMLRTCSDPDLLAMLSIRNTAATMHRSFVLPWLDLSQYDGRLHTAWNQTRSLDGAGTRTGRIGSERPNLANVPNPHNGLPNLREAFLPEEGELWGRGDYNQQEFRITAHFEDGPIQSAYRDNPTVDFHNLTQALVKNVAGLDLTRKAIKGVNFCLLYGGGAPKLAQILGTTIEEAHNIKTAYFRALPGLLKLNTEVKKAAMGPLRGVRTIGGRMMPMEPPKIDPKLRFPITYEYKMLNKLIQGSAADMTKKAIIDFCFAGTGATLLITVYDEIDISMPPESDCIAVLNEKMCAAFSLDVPMRADMSVGDSWGNLKGWAP